MPSVHGFLDQVNAVLWHDWVLFFVLGVGILFTLWSGFGQYRALTHGVVVTTGRYDRQGDPGAVSHFQALSAALSATVGLGNIAGVALAVSLGGPGAVFWMWVTGFVGMALKMTEVTQAMLYRNVDDPENPHGGAMWVASRGLAARSTLLAPIGRALAVLFCLALLVSTFTGGNMFQAWNVTDITREYFGVPGIVTGLVQMVLVGLVIIGGIHRIGAVAGRLVPLMCGLYLLAAVSVIALRIGDLPEVVESIFRGAFAPTEAQGAFAGGVAGWAFLRGMQRALFSNEAGQGSAPIAHCAARTDEPVREGVVAGLEPFIDTLCVCTLTAFVILLSGTWNRPPEGVFTADGRPVVVEVAPSRWTLEEAVPPSRSDGLPWSDGDRVFTLVEADPHAARGSRIHRLAGEVELANGKATIAWDSLPSEVRPVLTGSALYQEYRGATLTARAFDRIVPGLGLVLVPATAWLFALSTMISWSYYGEQAIVYLFGVRRVLAYRILYCLLVLAASTPLVRTEAELDVLSTLGTGLMLIVNLPIMLLFGGEAMREYRSYFRRLDSGEFETPPERMSARRMPPARRDS